MKMLNLCFLGYFKQTFQVYFLGKLFTELEGRFEIFTKILMPKTGLGARKRLQRIFNLCSKVTPTWTQRALRLRLSLWANRLAIASNDAIGETFLRSLEDLIITLTINNTYGLYYTQVLYLIKVSELTLYGLGVAAPSRMPFRAPPSVKQNIN